MMTFNDFIETPLGLLPREWPLIPIRNLGKVVTGRTPSTNEEKYYRGCYKLISPANLGTKLYVDSAHRWLSDEGLAISSVLPKHSVLVSCIGYIGKTGITTDEKSATNQQINAIICNDIADPHFVYYLMTFWKGYLATFARVTTVPILNKTNFENIFVPLPPLPEQRAIAHVLTTVRQAIEASERVIAAARELKRSLMKHLFTYGPVPIDQADQVPLKQTEIGEVPEDWIIQPLGNAATLQRGKDLPLSERYPGKYPVVGSNGIVGYHSKYVARGPGVLIGRSGSVGRVNRIYEDYWALNTTLWVKDFHGNNENFIFYLLKMFDFNKYTAGVSVPTLNRNLVHPVMVGIPQLTKQEQISSILDISDNKLLIERKRHGALSSLFSSLLHNLMTGKVRVKPTPTPP